MSLIFDIHVSDREENTAHKVYLFVYLLYLSMYLLIMFTGFNKDNLTVSYRLGFYSTQGVQVCQCNAHSSQWNSSSLTSKQVTNSTHIGPKERLKMPLKSW